MSAPPVPFLDLVTPHRELADELTAVFARALDTAGFIGGPMVDEFEKTFAAYCTAAACAGVGNGTDALWLALRAAGVKAGDTVVTVPNTFIATTEAITVAGAHPEFVDIDERIYNMDPTALRSFLENDCTRDGDGPPVSRRTNRPVTAVVPVHLYGQMADMDAITAIADEHGLIVIEDAAQAQGAEYRSTTANGWQRAGSIGKAGAFSFYPGKNLGACGEAGAVTTQDEALAAAVRQLRDHGQARKYYHDVEGWNARLDAMQAGFLTVKLAHLDGWNVNRRSRAREYGRLFHDMKGVIAPFEPEWSRAVFHLYVIRVANRDGLIEHLKGRGIGAGIHYPIPLHRQKAYEHLGLKEGSFPVTEKVSAEIVSLPMFPGLTAEQQQRVADAVAEFVSR